jgi:S-ribosylhomocysteine lyase LuxS involved in autoinducer biosynthesis
MSRPDPARRQHQAAHLLAQFLREHPDLPAIDWIVSQHGLHAHFYLCDVDAYDQRKAFAAWTTALGLAQAPHRGPDRGLPGASDMHAYRFIDDVLVILTATAHSF